jgi:hypothetical protein
MTPEEARGKRNIQTVSVHPGAEVLFHEAGQPAVLKFNNDRGPIEVLVAECKVDETIETLLGEEPMTLTGFFRRRSGFRADGSRHFIWCLVLFSADVAVDDLQKAA